MNSNQLKNLKDKIDEEISCEPYIEKMKMDIEKIKMDQALANLWAFVRKWPCEAWPTELLNLDDIYNNDIYNDEPIANVEKCVFDSVLNKLIRLREHGITITENAFIQSGMDYIAKHPVVNSVDFTTYHDTSLGYIHQLNLSYKCRITMRPSYNSERFYNAFDDITFLRLILDDGSISIHTTAYLTQYNLVNDIVTRLHTLHCKFDQKTKPPMEETAEADKIFDLDLD